MIEEEQRGRAKVNDTWSIHAFFLHLWPYLAMLAFAVFGVAYTSVSRQAMTIYWMILVPVFGLVCIWIVWRGSSERERWRAVASQALHWGAVMLAMYLAFVADMEKAMSAEASALVVLVVLALGTFTAGVHLRSWPISIVGTVLALGVPIFAWLEERTLLFALGGIAMIAFVVLIALSRNKHPISNSELRRLH
jgi:hypothetical protein